MASLFRGTIVFFEKLGVFDVILPFLLVFVIVFAILEKTRVFGTEKIGKEIYPRKGINSMVAFVVALFFVASTKLVGLVMGVLAQTVVLLLLPILFLMLVGTFHTGEKEFQLEGWTKSIFIVILFIAIILIFLANLGWLDIAYKWVISNWNSQIFSSLVFLIVMVGGIFLIVGGGPKNKDKDKKKDDDDD